VVERLNLFPLSVPQKYGCVPQTLYPESYSSSNSSKMDGLLVNKLREFNCELRALHKSLTEANLSSTQVVAALRRRKDEQMKIVYAILSVCLGTPPKPSEDFVWEYYDRDGKFCSIPKTTPREFYQKYGGGKAGDSFSIINDPRNAFETLYTVERLGNVLGKRPVQCECAV
jgi:bleomycin hydrolase